MDENSELVSSMGDGAFVQRKRKKGTGVLSIVVGWEMATVKRPHLNLVSATPGSVIFSNPFLFLDLALP